MNGPAKQISGFAEENNPVQDHHSASEAKISRYATDLIGWLVGKLIYTGEAFSQWLLFEAP